MANERGRPPENKRSEAKAHRALVKLGGERLGPFRVAGAKRYVRVYVPKALSAPAPLLFMFDAQNLFGDEGSFVGGWHLHDTVERLAEDGAPAPVVVGIDHGYERRLHELSPFTDPLSDGRFGELLGWIADDLLPNVRARYPVRGERAATFIGGSSMGGLASLYAVLTRPDLFAGAMAMSPSVWFAKRAILVTAKTAPSPKGVRLYLDAGGEEDRGYAVVRNAELLARTLFSRGFAKRNLRLVIDPEGRHSEADWRRRAPEALRWLLRRVENT